MGRQFLWAFPLLLLSSFPAAAEQTTSAWTDAVPRVANGREFYVTARGTPFNAGTAESGWDLRTTLLGEHEASPGDVIWLREGTYRGNLECKLKGEADKPIIIRAYPGERVVLDGVIQIGGKPENAGAIWLWGLEITSFVPRRAMDFNGLPGVTVYHAPNVKLINLIVHDKDNDGVALWANATDAEIHGCLLYYNGFRAEYGGALGSGIQSQNRSGAKSISDNIIFDNFLDGVTVTGSNKAAIKGYNVEGNILFNNGGIMGKKRDNIFFAGGAPLSNIRIANNYTYHTPDDSTGGSHLGKETFKLDNDDVIVTGNYWIGGERAITVCDWNKAIFTDNTCYGQTAILSLELPEKQAPANYQWNNNKYYGAGGKPFIFKGKDREFDAWKKLTGFDADSVHSAAEPTGVWSFTRPNKYEAGRAHIVIYNWERAANVAVDVSAALTTGDKYEVRSAQNFFGAPVLAGVYNGQAIGIPMTELQGVAAVTGKVANPPRHTAPEFGAFVLLKK